MATTNQSKRVNFSRMQKHMPYPDFLDIQLKSFHDFVQMDSTPEQRRKEGLFKVFNENFPINDTRNSFTLAFLDYEVEQAIRDNGDAELLFAFDGSTVM